MSADAVAVTGFLVLFALMLLRVPVGMAMGLVGVTGFSYLVNWDAAFKIVGHTSMRTVTDYTFGVIPMFLLMGAFVTNSGMSRELFRAANGFLGHRRGGLGVATIAACGGFAAISGSSVATAATFSIVAYPEMRRYGYPQSFAAGVIAAGGTLGAMLPPSTVLAVYGIITEQDIGKLFIAGIVPGILAASMYMITVGVIVWARPKYLPAGPRTPWRERLKGLRDGRGRRVFDRRAARPPDPRGHSSLAAAGDAHRCRGVHGADRCAAVRLFPHHHPDAAESDRVPHRPRARPLRGAGADHGDVRGAGMPDGCACHGHPDRPDHLSRDQGTRFRPDLVRRHHRDDGGAGADPSAGRNGRIRDKKRDPGHKLLDDLRRCAAAHRDRRHSAGDSDRLPDHRLVASVAHVSLHRVDTGG